MRDTHILGAICAAVLAVILSLGLWPFHAPANQVSWLKDRPGLAFYNDGSAISSTLPAPHPAEPGVSLELWLRPGSIWDSKTILGFSSPRSSQPFLVRQSWTDLELQNESTAKLYVNNALREARPSFLTIASGENGTSVYVDGVLAKKAPLFRISASQVTGRLVVGDAPGQCDSWRGLLFGLALYRGVLTPVDASLHYDAWTRQGRPTPAAPESRTIALYLFDERSGRIAKNAAGPHADLTIPETYTVVDKIFLEPFWTELSTSWSYISSAIKNIVGFVPFGFSFYAWLTALRVKRATLLTVLLGTATSLTIEVLQACLPTRDSGTTDIFTNTLGTWIGVACCRPSLHILAGFFPAASSHFEYGQERD